MKADVLLQEFSVIENGTSLEYCPGLLVVNWTPTANMQQVEPGGKKITLKDNQTIATPNDYREQFLLRADVSGRSWLDVQLVSIHDFGLIGMLMTELAGLASKSLPIGSSWLDKLSDTVKKGAPQIIATGRSEVFSIDQFPRQVKIALSAPADLFGEMLYRQQEPPPGEDWRGERERLLRKGAPNGSITFTIDGAD